MHSLPRNLDIIFSLLQLKERILLSVVSYVSKTFSTAKNSTLNLLKHLRGQHSALKLVEKMVSTKVLTTVSAEDLNRTVAGYIFEEMLPISTLDLC